MKNHVFRFAFALSLFFPMFLIFARAFGALSPVDLLAGNQTSSALVEAWNGLGAGESADGDQSPPPTETETPTTTPTPTATDSPTPTETATATPTETATATATTQPIETATATSTATETPSATPADTSTPTPTITTTATPTATETPSATPADTSTPTSTTAAATPTATETPSATPADTSTPTSTATTTATPAATKTATSSPTATIPPADTSTPTLTPTATVTGTPTETPTPTATGTATSIPTETSTPTVTETATRTRTPTPTATETPEPPPGIPMVIDDGAFLADNTRLHATWSAAAPHSGIAEYRYAVGTSPGGSSVVGWTSAGTSTEVTQTGLSLVHGRTYFVSVKARSNAGHWSEVGSSDGLTVDMTSPLGPVVYDNGVFVNSESVLYASWNAPDPESGIAEYQYAVTSTLGTHLSWTSAGTATYVNRSISPPIPEGTTYYFSVKAKNNAGLWSAVGTSDGITVDAQPPTLSITNLADGQVITSTLVLRGTATDANSGLERIEIDTGRESGYRLAAGTDDWTFVFTPTLNGPTTVKARAIDRAGNISETAPIAVSVGVAPAAPANLRLTYLSAATATLDWDPVADGNLDGYRLYWSVSPITWSNSADAGLSTSYTVSGLLPAHRYRFAVSAYDSTGYEGVKSGEVYTETRGFTVFVPLATKPYSAGW